MTNFQLLSPAMALLAFMVAFYSLAARERKTPTIVNTIYSLTLVLLVAIFVIIVPPFLPVSPRLEQLIRMLGNIMVLLAFLYGFLAIWKVYNRHRNFRDDNLLKNLAVIQRCRSLLRSVRAKPTYEHDPLNLPDTLRADLAQCGIQSIKLLGQKDLPPNLSPSLFFRVSTLSGADEITAALAKAFLKHGCAVQYLSCCRHPLEFVLGLKENWGSSSPSFTEVAERVVVIDAYTPHFGFTDSIHAESRKRLKTLGVECVLSKASYPGMHTATARAFNLLKKKQGKKRPRQPALVCYEMPHAIADLESEEQYRIFVRHVLGSERLWGGMLTVFIEDIAEKGSTRVVELYSTATEDVGLTEGGDKDANGE